MDATMSELADQLLNIRTGGSKAKPKLHKPLLITLLLARYLNHGLTTAAFPDIRDQLAGLIARYDGSAQPRPEYPFWRLRNDGFWVIDDSEHVETYLNGNANPTALTGRHLGRWTPAALRELRTYGADTFLNLVLATYIPANRRDEPLADVGLLPQIPS
jgi:hypothetical protein